MNNEWDDVLDELNKMNTERGTDDLTGLYNYVQCTLDFCYYLKKLGWGAPQLDALRQVPDCIFLSFLLMPGYHSITISVAHDRTCAISVQCGQFAHSFCVKNILDIYHVSRYVINADGKISSPDDDSLNPNSTTAVKVKNE